MELNAKIYIAGHRGLVGSALVRNLENKGYQNLIKRTHSELDLTDQQAVAKFFKQEKPDYVFLAAARVGGIHANNTFPAEFIHDNLAIQNNIIHQAYLNNVKRLLFLGSSCIYPKHSPQPLREEYLLTGSLEETNRPYALAKIAGIEMCWSYNRQYGTNFLAVMPTNLYGIGDNYHPENSHVIPGLIHKFHQAVMNNESSVTIWGTGKPRREFMFNDDMAQACIHIMNLPDAKFENLLASDRNGGPAPVINIGVGEDITIAELANLIAKVTGFHGDISYDTSMPDGTPRKLMDVSRLHQLDWKASTYLHDGLTQAYDDFLLNQTTI